MVKLSKTNAACEGFFGRLKVEFFYGRDWSGWTAERFIEELSAYIRWYREERLKTFDEAGAPCTTRYGAAERGSGSPLRLSEKLSASPNQS